MTKRYPGTTHPAVEALSLEVNAGEILALVGPSGCGKTTALRCIVGLEQADAGSIRRGDLCCQDTHTFLPPESRGIGLVFQDYALFPHLNVLRNVMYGVRRGGRAQRRRKAEQTLQLVGMEHLQHRRVQELSGGQQQRVAIARALAPGTDVLLLDEPFSNLDTDLRGNIRHELRQLVRRTGLAVILVTHDQEEALSTADRLAVMRDGRVIQQGPPEAVYRQPRTAFVAQFLGRTNLMAGQASGHVAETPIGRVQLNREAHGPVLLSLRPEHLALSGRADPCQGATILSREFKGHDLTYRVEMCGRQWLIQTDAICDCRAGDATQLRLLAPAHVVEDDLRSQS